MSPDHFKFLFFLLCKGDNRTFLFDNIVVNIICENVMESANCYKLIIIFIIVLKIIIIMNMVIMAITRINWQIIYTVE